MYSCGTFLCVLAYTSLHLQMHAYGYACARLTTRFDRGTEFGVASVPCRYVAPTLQTHHCGIRIRRGKIIKGTSQLVGTLPDSFSLSNLSKQKRLGLCNAGTSTGHRHMPLREHPCARGDTLGASPQCRSSIHRWHKLHRS